LSEKLIYKNIKLNTEKHATHRNKLTRGKLCEIYYLYIQCIHEKCQAIWTNIIERKSIIRLIMRLTVKTFVLEIISLQFLSNFSFCIYSLVELIFRAKTKIDPIFGLSSTLNMYRSS
jgi:hypothetical protein